mmetsp:Transcript_31770/g.39195  ORF Transcript_31770/g.39195 Transcript_31770/m.39195 type:complete len:222 (-) Transcript_31770:732-1397(-)
MKLKFQIASPGESTPRSLEDLVVVSLGVNKQNVDILICSIDLLGNVCTIKVIKSYHFYFLTAGVVFWSVHAIFYAKRFCSGSSLWKRNLTRGTANSGLSHYQTFCIKSNTGSNFSDHLYVGTHWLYTVHHCVLHHRHAFWDLQRREVVLTTNTLRKLALYFLYRLSPILYVKFCIRRTHSHNFHGIVSFVASNINGKEFSLVQHVSVHDVSVSQVFADVKF